MSGQFREAQSTERALRAMLPRGVVGCSEFQGRVSQLKRYTLVLLMQVALIFGLRVPCFAQLSPSASTIDSNVTAALNNLYAHNDAARALGGKAKAVLVFPDIKKGAFLIGAQFGFGALRQGRKTVGYYRTAAASYGFQAGVKQFGYALFFMNSSALNYLNQSGGWAIGTGPSLVVVDEGFAKSVTTSTLRSDIYAFVFNQQGLMGGVGIEGSKITQFQPN
jgi:lipid-binding SYLF domain-containing protein